MYHSPEDCHVNPGGPSFWRYAYNGMVRALHERRQEVPALLHLPMLPASSASVPATPTTLLTRPAVARASVCTTAPAAAKSVATTSTQAHSGSDPLAASLAMYGKEGILNLVEESLVAQPPVQAMVESEAEPDWQCAGLDDVIANCTKMAAVPVPDNIVASPPAKESDKPPRCKTTPAGSTAKFKQVLAELIGTMENLLAADVVGFNRIDY